MGSSDGSGGGEVTISIVWIWLFSVGHNCVCLLCDCLLCGVEQKWAKYHRRYHRLPQSYLRSTQIST